MDPTSPQPLPLPKASQPSRVAARFRRSFGVRAGMLLVSALLTIATFGPILEEHSPVGKNVSAGLSTAGAPLPPSTTYPLGTDMLGRCVAARLAFGIRLSLELGLLATALSVAIGTLVGLFAGYASKLADAILMRLTDMFLSFPFLLLAVVLGAALGESGMGGLPIAVVLGSVGWMTIARVIRERTLALRDREFIEAARALGAGSVRILCRHVLPNVSGPIVVLATVSIAQMILAESTLSYLGLGAPPPTPTLGRMLYEGQSYLRGAPWLVVFPGMTILAAVLGFNLLGDGLRHALDPKN
ncbi:MAG: ABC transporter permease [Pseudomonadota bacterium]